MGRAMLSKSLIQLSVDGQGSVTSLLFGLRPNYGGGDEDNGNLLQKGLIHALLYSGLPTLQQATTDTASSETPDTPRQVWVSLLWGHCTGSLVQDSTVDHHLNRHQCSWLLIYFLKMIF